MLRLITLGLLTIFGSAAVLLPTVGAAETLLNASYDPTRELWKSVNQVFIPAWQQQTGETIEIKQSHGGSGSQARAVVDGLEADVVTLAMWPDTDAIRKVGLISRFSRVLPCAVPINCTPRSAIVRAASASSRRWLMKTILPLSISAVCAR